MKTIKDKLAEYRRQFPQDPMAAAIASLDIRLEAVEELLERLQERRTASAAPSPRPTRQAD